MSLVSGAPKVALRTKRESMAAALLRLWPVMWPSGRPDLKARVGMALAVLVLAKIVTVLVPYTYKWATDALTSKPTVAATTARYRQLNWYVMIAAANANSRNVGSVFRIV